MLRRVQERISGHEFWASWKVTGSALARNSAGPHPAGPGASGVSGAHQATGRPGLLERVEALAGHGTIFSTEDIELGPHASKVASKAGGTLVSEAFRMALGCTTFHEGMYYHVLKPGL